MLAWKLRDVPELDYYSTDLPYPRGELLVKTKLTVPGYYGHTEARPLSSKELPRKQGMCMSDLWHHDLDTARLWPLP